MALAVVAGAALIANCLLTCPPWFSAAHQTDTTLLKPVVQLLGLDGRFPTKRGLEIRDLAFYAGAALLTLIAGIRLLAARRRPRLGEKEFLDIRRRIASPFFWWFLLLLVSVLSTTYSHAPRALAGQTVIRFLHAAWWLPLAAMLRPADARRLAGALLIALVATAALGQWYHASRGISGAPLSYPLGNRLWMAACLLPGIPIAAALTVGQIAARRRRAALRCAAALSAFGLLAITVYMTGSRSCLVGLGAAAVAFAVLVVPRYARLPILLLACVGAAAGARYVQAVRPHSVRARVEYQWPYALRLFDDKKMTGHGDGAYSLRAGSFARADQLRDPSVMSFDNETKGVVHAHNEFLELLADLGIVGCAAFAAALVTTLVRVYRFMGSTPGRAAVNRWWVVGLASALVGLMAEQCFDNALRNPGFPAVFLTVWAVLWALVRDPAAAVPAVADDRRVQRRTIRVAGGFVAAAGLVLAYLAVQNWRGVRAHFEADTSIVNGRYAAAVERADFAARHVLDPFQRIAPQITAVRAMTIDCSAQVSASSDPPTTAQLELASDALQRLHQIQIAAPDFLWVSRLDVALCRTLALAYSRLGQPANEQYYRQRLIAAVQKSRDDDPFDIRTVQDLWQLRQDATVIDRMFWLRCLMRAGETDPALDALVRNLMAHPDFGAGLGDLLNIAIQDRRREPDDWRDPLSPETHRLAALAHFYSGRPSRAADLALEAAKLYATTGVRLFAGRAAALHESVRYAFSADPTAGTGEYLQRLADAWALDAPRVDPAEPLPGPLGRARLSVLIAAGRETDAGRQIERLNPDSPIPMPQLLAAAYLRTAAPFAAADQFASAVRTWARRAVDLAPDLPDAHALALQLALRAGDDDTAHRSARRFLDLSDGEQQERARQYLDSLQTRYPGSTLWPRLGRPTPTSRPQPRSPSSAPTPSSAPGGDGLP